MQSYTLNPGLRPSTTSNGERPERRVIFVVAELLKFVLALALAISVNIFMAFICGQICVNPPKYFL